MINLLANGKYILVAGLRHHSTMRYTGIVSKIHAVNKSIALNCSKFVNRGEPAAVLVFPIKIKVVEEIRPESTAAGSLCLKPGSAVIGHWENLKEQSLVICHWALGGGFGDMMRYGYMIAGLLGSFLIVNFQFSIFNCQLSSINETRRNRHERS